MLQWRWTWSFSDFHLVNKSLPWDYSFRFVIEEISNINDKDQTMSISMYFAVSWLEPRLQINSSASEWTEDRTGPLNVDNPFWCGIRLQGSLCFRRWTSRRKSSNTFGIRNLRSTVWTHSADRGCWRRCPGSESTRTRPSPTSWGSGSQSHAAWILTTTPWMPRHVSFKLEAVSLI